MWCCLLLRPTVSRTEGTAERGLFKMVWFLRAQQSKHVLLKSYHRSKTWVLFSVAETQRSVSAASDVWADIQCRIQTECKSSGWFTNAPHCLSLQKSLFFLCDCWHALDQISCRIVFTSGFSFTLLPQSWEHGSSQATDVVKTVFPISATELCSSSRVFITSVFLTVSGCATVASYFLLITRCSWALIFVPWRSL